MFSQATARILVNLSKLLGGKAAAGVISLGSIAIATRILGLHDFGVLNLVHGYATFLGGLIAFSGFQGIVHYGAQALQAGQRQRMSQLIWLMTLIELAMALLAILIAMAGVKLAGAQMNWPPEAMNFAYIYCFAILATVRATPMGMLQLVDRFDLIALHHAIMPTARLMGSLGVLVFGGGLSAFLWVWLVSALVEGLSMWLLAWIGWRHRSERWRGLPSLSGSGAANPGLVWFIFITNFDVTLRELAPRAAPLIIGWMLGPAATGLYALAQRATMILYQPAQMLAQAAYPVIARLLAAGDYATAHASLIRSILLAVLSSAAVLLLMILFGEELLALLGGAPFAVGAALLVQIAAGRAIMAATPTYAAALMALGKPQASARASMVSNLALLPLLPLFVHLIGVEGAGYHAILQAVVLAAMLALAYHRTMATLLKRR